MYTSFLSLYPNAAACLPSFDALKSACVYGRTPSLSPAGADQSCKARKSTATEVASGAPLLADVEFGRGRRLFALSQGVFPAGAEAGSPALPNTGSLVEVNRSGTFTVITEGLSQPTSLEFAGNTAYVVTLGGEIWKIDNVSRPPYGESR